MADNTFRTTRRDPPAQGGQQMDDPLAELARLIGQGEPVPSSDRAPRHYDAPPLNGPAPGFAPGPVPGPTSVPTPGPSWAADDRYADPQDPAPAQYNERQAQYDERQPQYDERYDAPRLADPNPPYRPAPPTYDPAYEQPDQYAAPPAQRYDARGSEEPRYYDDEHDSIQDLPSFLPRARDDRYDYAQDGVQAPAQILGQAYPQDQQGDPDDPSYALEDYEDEEAPPRKRRGFAIVAALLGLMVLGTAGAFGYRAMFGGSMLPSLPPIIRADNTPNKIVPAGTAAGSSGQTNASNAGSPDKLVSREEKPVDVPAPASTPRVVSTIPIFPDPNAGLQSSIAPGSQGMAGQSMSGAVAPGGTAAGSTGGPLALGPTGAAPGYGGSIAPPPSMPPATGMAGQGAPMQVQPAGSSAKKIHTVAIHPGQSDDADAAAAAPPQQAPARAPAPSRPVAPRPLAAAPVQGGNAPLSIVPSQGGDTAAPARTRTALAHPAAPAPEPAPSAGGGYSVQVSSQRSEAEAQSAYRGLQAKYPTQLGGHTSTVRQVNLGDKGVFYRTLVGPYASMEQAAQMCSSLKAAGGSCIVQRN